MIKEIYWGVTPAAFAIDVFVKVPMQTIVTVRYFLSREKCNERFLEKINHRDHTSLDEGQVGELFREARTKDASYAKEVGIVHEICDVNIPPGDPIISLVFKR